MQYFANFRRKSNHFTFQNSHEHGQFCRRICEFARAKCNSTEFVEEVSSLTEMGEVQENTQTAAITQSNVYDQASTRGRFNVGSNRGRFQARGRGGRPFVRHTGENDPYDMSIIHLREPNATDRYT